jgi:hypothetical protein
MRPALPPFPSELKSLHELQLGPGCSSILADTGIQLEFARALTLLDVMGLTFIGAVKDPVTEGVQPRSAWDHKPLVYRVFRLQGRALTCVTDITAVDRTNP